MNERSYQDLLHIYLLDAEPTGYEAGRLYDEKMASAFKKSVTNGEDITYISKTSC